MLSTSPPGRLVRGGGLRAPVAFGLDVLRVLLDTPVPRICFPYDAVLLVGFVAPLNALQFSTFESTRITTAVVTVTGLI